MSRPRDGRLFRSWTWRACGWISATCAFITALSGVACGTPPRTLEIATTSSVDNSGLLATLLPPFETSAGIEVRVHVAGSGRALQMLEEGLVQLVISHAPDAEARMLARHPEWLRRELAYNAFIIVGPPADPAGVRGAADAVEAFRRIASANVRFVSRGDHSGTHERENSLWQAAGQRPPPDRLIVSGRGMAQALRHADEAAAYTLADDATFAQLAPGLELNVVLEGDPRLRNVYAVIHPPAEPAATFGSWLAEGEGRTLIRDFRIQGRPAFHLLTPD